MNACDAVTDDAPADVTSGNNKASKDAYVFTMFTVGAIANNTLPHITVKLHGMNTQVMIDSGSSINLIVDGS